MQVGDRGASGHAAIRAGRASQGHYRVAGVVVLHRVARQCSHAFQLRHVDRIVSRCTRRDTSDLTIADIDLAGGALQRRQTVGRVVGQRTDQRGRAGAQRNAVAHTGVGPRTERKPVVAGSCRSIAHGHAVDTSSIGQGTDRHAVGAGGIGISQRGVGMEVLDARCRTAACQGVEYVLYRCIRAAAVTQTRRHGTGPGVVGRGTTQRCGHGGTQVVYTGHHGKELRAIHCVGRSSREHTRRHILDLPLQARGTNGHHRGRRPRCRAAEESRHADIRRGCCRAGTERHIAGIVRHGAGADCHAVHTDRVAVRANTIGMEILRASVIDIGDAVVGRKQLRTIHRIRTGGAEGALMQIGDRGASGHATIRAGRASQGHYRVAGVVVLHRVARQCSHTIQLRHVHGVGKGTTRSHIGDLTFQTG